MARPPAAREKVLAAFASLVATQGEQAATMDAVAAQAGVSKGGLLYHFGSREALVDGLVERFLEAGIADVEAMRIAPEGAVAHYLDTSAQAPDELQELYVATSRITQTRAEAARAALAHVESLWYEELLKAVGDEALARLIAVAGDGLYLHAIRGDRELANAHRRAIEPLVQQLLARPEGSTEDD